MKAKTFIKNVKEILGLDDFEVESKKKSVKTLLKKLYKKKKETIKTIGKKDAKLELSIIELKIKKGQKILKKLKEDKKS